MTRSRIALETLTALLLAVSVASADRAQDLAKQAAAQKPSTCASDTTTSAACHTSFPDGCSKSAHPNFDAYLNFLKNQTPSADLSPIDMLTEANFQTLEGTIAQLPTPLTNRNHAEHASALADAGEGNIHGVVGYLYYYEVTTGKETSNCQLTGGEKTDYHIGIGFDPTLAQQLKDGTAAGQDLHDAARKASVVVEMTPHYRALGHPGWTPQMLQSLVGRQVKVVGQLLVDNEHNDASADCGREDANEESCWRASVWELHPVTQFLACAAATCATDSTNWQNIDQMQPEVPTALAPAPGEFGGQIARLADDRSVVAVAPLQAPGHATAMAVNRPELRTDLKSFNPRDLVNVKADGQQLQALSRQTVAVTVGWRLLALALGIIAILIVALLFTGRQLPLLVVGVDGRYSKSQFQMAVWFFALVATYVATVILRAWFSNGRLVGGVSIPGNLLLLSGLSAITFVGAKQITTSKQQQALATGARVRKQRSARKFPDDLLNDDQGRPDFGDFQLVLLTLIAVATYVTSVFGWLSTLELASWVQLPDVDTTILAALGLGHGAYLVKKQIQPPGGDGPEPTPHSAPAPVAPPAPAPPAPAAPAPAAPAPADQ